jgi:biofilm PGA synthesis N-glycosyltransferase PgaC
MYFWVFLFFFSILIVFYNYAGYALIVVLFNRLKRKPADPKSTSFHQPPSRTAGAAIPSLTFIVAAYNEEDCIRQKILNSLDQDYPAGKVEFLFVTDGSTDRTVDIIREYPSIRLVHQAAREGKSGALNRAVQASSHEILIFSDANTLLNRDAIKNISRHYADPKVGGVAGEKKVLSSEEDHDPAAGSQEVGSGEGLYWKYESWLKKIDSEFYTVVGAAGELFSVRKHLFETLASNIILDDFVISLKVAAKGFRIIYEPEAFASELPSFSMKDEKKRKVRIAAGGFQAIVLLKRLLLFWRHPRLSFLYISHRVLRWTLTPLCLALALVSNIILVCLFHAPLFYILLAGQLLFYGGAWAASLSPSKAGQIKLFRISYYFVFMNLNVYLGFFRFIRGRQSGIWEKARRQAPVA